MDFIFLVETSSKSRSDEIYIRGFLKHYYKVTNKYSFIYMNGKSNYNKFETEIKKQINKSKRNCKIIIFIDIDKNNSDPNLNNKIKLYCKDHNYELVWFYRNIEDVFLRKEVHDNDKSKAAQMFINKDKYHFITSDISCSNLVEAKGKSNIKLIFDKYFNLYDKYKNSKILD